MAAGSGLRGIIEMPAAMREHAVRCPDFHTDTFAPGLIFFANFFRKRRFLC
jgi:hypothetical protein